MIIATHRTTIDGKEYKLILATINGGKTYYVRNIRKMSDGSEVEAFLSSRQWKAENRVKSHFAKEINDYMNNN